MPKKRVQGHLWPVSPADKEWARLRMVELGISQSDLARQLGTSTALISLFFDETGRRPMRHSRFWPDMVKALGGVPPTVSSPSGTLDEHKRVILEHWDRLSDEDKRAVVQLIRSLTSRQP